MNDNFNIGHETLRVLRLHSNFLNILLRTPDLH